MTGTTSGQTALTTATDSDDTENYLTVSLVAALQALANLFESATGHAHDGSGKGAPIPTAGIAATAVTGAKIAANTVTGDKLSLGQLTNSIGSNIALNNTGAYFDGPTVAQGSTGTWFATGTVTLQDGAGGAAFNVKLHDGTTVFASARADTTAASKRVSISLSGYIASPAGNIRISVNDPTSTSGSMDANVSTNSKDCTISVFRIA